MLFKEYLLDRFVAGFVFFFFCFLAYLAVGLVPSFLKLTFLLLSRRLCFVLLLYVPIKVPLFTLLFCVVRFIVLLKL